MKQVVSGLDFLTLTHYHFSIQHGMLFCYHGGAFSSIQFVYCMFLTFFTLLGGKSHFYSLTSVYSVPKRHRKHAASQLHTQETQLFQNNGP